MTRKHPHKHSFITALALCAALCLTAFAAACGGSGENTGPETGAAAAETPDPETEAAAAETPETAETTTETPAQTAETAAPETPAWTALTLSITPAGGEPVTVPVTWEENDSVRALAELAAEAPGGALTVQASAYGGFEQVGDLGQTLPRDDVRITTEPGDIVLYAGHEISVFHAPNTWEYTRLGHIDLGRDEVAELLAGQAVTLVFAAG